MKQQEKSKYIPLNVSETAVLQDANTLLPRDEIYVPLAKLIGQARDRADEAKGRSLNELRAHNAISIDGARGTGKTAVLVNLKRYLELEHKALLSDVHILEPIDPTLLEDGESLFLHIIVAAVLHDDEIKRKQRENPDKARALNQILDKLAHALESVETQKSHHGMDKVRAMYSNKHLADCVQDFFFEAVQLIGKKLLVLPVDDVDTSLNRAFENLEIIRRYLTTPYVLPIVSGDRALYNEVTWRDFHGRLTRDSKFLSESAYERSMELAEEYQRKILPFPRRLTMPVVSSYWQWSYDREQVADKGITLGNSENPMPLANFVSWLEIFLTGPVNGQEDSRLLLPIPSIRSLTQLVSHCSTFIPQLPDAIRTAKSELEVRRVWQMPTVPLEAIAAFQGKHTELSEKLKREYGDAYKLFSEKMRESPIVDYSFDKTKQGDGSEVRLTKNDLAKKMADYFRFEPTAGEVYLVLLAKQYWQRWAVSSPLTRQGNIFDTPLFQPLAHNRADLVLFDKTEDLSAWQGELAKRLPEEWLAGLKSHKTILPYPIAEVGVNAGNKWDYPEEIKALDLKGLDDTGKLKATFLVKLLVQYNFYTNAKQTMLLNIGRIFELIIASIAGPVSRQDLQAILDRAPFFSTRALAPTKTLLVDPNEIGQKNRVEEQFTVTASGATEEEADAELALVAELQEKIDVWRHEYNLDQIDLSPWLVYKVFNKVYSQVASSDKIPSGMKDIGTALNMVARIFYATWSAFGSFEKGELFGLPNVVATTNLNTNKLRNFEKHDHFTINVGPFVPTSSQSETKDGELFKNRSKFGEQTRTVSYCLAMHPLKMWIDEAIQLEWPSSRASKEALFEEFQLPETPRIPWAKIGQSLEDNGLEQAKEILERFEKEFGANDSVVKELRKRVNKLTQESNS